MPNNSDPSKKRNPNAYLRYSSIGFQMIAAMLLGAFGGIRLDTYLGTHPLMLIVLLLWACFTRCLLLLKW
jgi:F0F1-type ATP synthase assembly protein I